ncbi:MAG: hypothetical protein ACD_20C00337G0036 [uncultured bacterium]|nr:MAG: hypothetical protein ACD_20C00337G0036 [uncultured bacterium]HBH18344.1 hypothetical protein [Cyanobacteria bacterium UBA9579]
MILEFKVDENVVQAAWLRTLYDLVEELNCRCNTYLEETYNKAYSNFIRTRIVEVYGSATMVSWLKLRMERYNHLVDSYNDVPQMKIISDKDED